MTALPKLTRSLSHGMNDLNRVQHLGRHEIFRACLIHADAIAADFNPSNNGKFPDFFLIVEHNDIHG